MMNNNLSKISNRKSERYFYDLLNDSVDQELKSSIPDYSTRFDNLPEIVVKYLYTTVSKFSWMNKLLLCAIMMNEEGESSLVHNHLTAIHCFSKWCRNEGLEINQGFDVGRLILKYHNSGKKIHWVFSAYNSMLNHCERFLDDFKGEIGPGLQKYLLPNYSGNVDDLIQIVRNEQEAAREKRKKQTAEVKRKLTNVVNDSKIRFEWMLKFYETTKTIKNGVKSGEIKLPINIKVPGFDSIGELEFRVWNKVQWISEHSEMYSERSFILWQEKEGYQSDYLFFQFVGEMPPDCWFLRAIKFGYLQSGNGEKTLESKAFSKEQNIPAVSLSAGLNAGLLISDKVTGAFICRAKKKLKISKMRVQSFLIWSHLFLLRLLVIWQY